MIKEWKAILDSAKLKRSTTAFILASVSYITKNTEMMSSQRDIAEEIAKFPEVQLSSGIKQNLRICLEL